MGWLKAVLRAPPTRVLEARQVRVLPKPLSASLPEIRKSSIETLALVSMM